ncbi:MOSC domain-containing protein [Bradyrhizobium sp. SRS-191]|uniref:MOSC domain-containing protein n=1 Tax=Bradyrhizobium sp. SRS-191 TaxID=2962606 RepID=UPI00211E6925|nr:MOSC domain-containing protein [Bradyrhizobium sp. SRS-191]
MSQISPARITGLYRYPVKGLTPEPLQTAPLRVGETLPADRRYALENGPTGFDPAAPVWKPKTAYLMLMRNERLAGFKTHFNDATNILTIRKDGAIVAQGDLESAEGRASVERFFAAEFADELRGPTKLLSGGGYAFTDLARKVISIINLASLAEIEQLVGAPIHPLRFRANLYVAGWPAWHETTLMGETLRIGSARLKVVKTTTRCAAVNVDPDTAARDLDIPPALMQARGNNECGIYAEVIEGGNIAVGDELAVEQPSLL